jgi:hypothetical protein
VTDLIGSLVGYGILAVLALAGSIVVARVRNRSWERRRTTVVTDRPVTIPVRRPATSSMCG